MCGVPCLFAYYTTCVSGFCNDIAGYLCQVLAGTDIEFKVRLFVLKWVER